MKTETASQLTRFIAATLLAIHIIKNGADLVTVAAFFMAFAIHDAILSTKD